MIEIQCTSCQTRYRIDERILPDDTPTFKCSRCGHVFSAEPRKPVSPRASAEGGRGAAAKPAPPQPSAVDAAEPAPPPAAAAPGADARAAATTAQGAAATSQQEPAVARAAAALAVKPPTAFNPRPAGSPGRRAAAQAPPAARERAAEPTRVADLAQSAASQAQPAAPQAAHEEPAPVRHDTEELIQRGFREEAADEAEQAGENLAFDFSDEPRAQGETSQSYAEKKWEVGDTDPSHSPPPRPKPRIRITDFNGDADEGSSLNQVLSRDRNLGRQPGQDFERVRPEEISAQAYRLEAELRGRSYRLHSAGFFIALFALVIVGFGILAMTISSAPIASAELLSALPVVGSGLAPAISPARRVALSQVEARYTTLKGDQSALVVSGTVENVTSAPLGAVQIEAALTGPTQESLRSQAIFCGNNLSSKMIGEMTPHEIEFFEKLDAPKNFTLAPQTSAPFVIVFIGPPMGAVHLQLRVVRADPAAAPAPVSSAGG
jgi:predicted Zn finger-like uncharacterized protein